MESNAFDIVCYLQKFPLSRVPVPPSHLKINPKGVYPMESNVFDVVSVSSSSSHCPLSPVPCPPRKINPKGVYPMESNLFVVSVTSSRPTVPCPR